MPCLAFTIKINKQYEMNKLTKGELKQLIGGICSSSNNDGDVVNLNKVEKCICYYNNQPKVTNDNQIEQCRCTCLVEIK